jgi:hypothetical protein
MCLFRSAGVGNVSLGISISGANQNVGYDNLLADKRAVVFVDDRVIKSFRVPVTA